VNWQVEFAKMLSEALSEEEVSAADVLDALASSALKLMIDVEGTAAVAYQDYVGGLT
jgi:hypothetical protein